MIASAFYIDVRGLPPETLTVVKFEGEETLTRPYRFDVDVIASSSSLPLDELLANPVTFTMKRGEDERKIHGIVTQLSQGGEASGGHYAYRVSFAPRISSLELSQHNRSFGTQSPMSVIDVITYILTDPGGLALGRDDYSVRVLQQESYPLRGFWAQYDETDFDFVHRLLEHWGIFYYFEQADDHERIVFTDSSSLAPLQTLDVSLHFDGDNRHVPGEVGLIKSLSRRLRSVTRKILLKDYNGETPQIALKAEAPVQNGTLGEYAEYAAHFMNDQEGRLFARARAEEMGCARDVYHIVTDSPFLSVGVVFDAVEHFLPSFNQSYLPTRIEHRGQQYVQGAFWEGGPGEDGYRNTVTAIPEGVPYRSARRIRRPVMAGVMPAIVEAPEEDAARATLDRQGRYKVAIDFDTAENPIYRHSAFLRKMQPYGGGANVGMHFPLLKETQVIIGWMDGDPDRPLIVGAVPNAQKSGPVRKLNQTQNVIRTASGIALIMNDGPGDTGAQNPPSAGESAGSAGESGWSGGRTRGGPSGSPSNPGTPSSRSGSGVYSAFIVPADGGTPPHYLRIGDIAVSDNYESQIVADPAFQAGSLAHRGTELTNGQYGGIFSYTSMHRTTTSRGNETTTVGGDHRLKIRGGSMTLIGAAGYHTAVIQPQGESNSTPDPQDGAPTGTAQSDDSGSSWSVKGFTSQTDGYAASVSLTPSVNYYDTAYIGYYNGVASSWTIGMKVDVSLGGSFTYTAGWGVSLSSGSGYSIGTSGGISDGQSWLDESAAIFATGALILGNRATAGTPMMTALAASAKIAAVASATSLGGMGDIIGQGYLGAYDKIPTLASSIGQLGIQGVGIVTNLGVYAGMLYKAKSFFGSAGGQSTLIANAALEPTIAIDDTGITLSHGTSTIAITATGVSITAQTITLTSGTLPDATTTIVAKDDGTLNVTANDISTTSPTYTLASTTPTVKGNATITGSLTATGAIDSSTSMSAPSANFGP
jgi:type VI secretion system VgrG family protein